MQYALMSLPKDNHTFLVDANELHALHHANALLDNPTTKDDDMHLPLQMVYGVYQPQPTFQFPKSEIKRHIIACVNQWLIHIDNLSVHYLKLHDIEILDISVMKSCGHCPKPHISHDVAFAALMTIPDGVTIGNGKTQAKTAYLNDGYDPLTALIHRKGLFSLVAPERRIKPALTQDNWHPFIDYKRAARYAQITR